MLDITAPHSLDLQDCGLRVLQYQEIIGSAVARQPDILDGPPIRIQEFLHTEVLPQLRLVNVASTDSYYYTLRTAIRQHLWTVEPKQHKTWPDPSKVIQKRKHSKTTDIRTQQEHSSTTPRESLKKYRQLQLWEAPQSIEVSNSTILMDVNGALTTSSTEEDNNMAQKEQTAQVQWLHRWFDESTQENLTHLPEADTWTGSSILRSLAKRKQQEHRHSR